MKTFKQIDWMIQVFLILYSLVILFVDKPPYQPFLGYFVVGGYQFASMLVHEFAGSFTARNGRRRYYHNAVYIIVAMMLTGLVLRPLLWIFLPMLYAGPLMAIFYVHICYDEVYHHMKRPLAQLK